MNKFESYPSIRPWFMALMLSALAIGCGGGGGGDQGRDPILGGSVALAPRVTATVPLATTPIVAGVAIDSKITATFSKEMAPVTITTAGNFTLACPAGTAVAGTVTYVASSRVATFSPTANLPAGTTCTATISTGAKDLAGNALAANFIWSFTTGVTADTTAPQLLTTGAFNGETNLPINRDSTATFTEAMDAATLATPAITFTVKETVSGNPVAGVVTYSGNTATFNPTNDLLPGTQYTSTISASAKDLSGNALIGGTRPNPWVWTTAASAPVADTTAPTVTLTSPADLAIGVAVNSIINASFSEEMRQSTMINTNFTVTATVSGIAVGGTVGYDVQNHIATFTPLVALAPDTSYTATVTNNATDLAGNALVVPAVLGLPKPNPWTFRTLASSVPVAPLAINLRSAGSFGIASRAGLTSTGVTVINGDVALHPLAGCTDSTGNLGASQTCLVKTYVSPTGMSVNGSIYWAGDPFDNGGTALTVTNDLNTAWTEGRAKVDTQAGVLVGEMGGKIIFPGVYHEANLGLAALGVATLDALGDQNAVFIFKVDSDFTDSGTLLLPTRIDLRNGALARNVWFVTGRDITIGSGTSWNGNILAGRDVTVNNGSTVIGRVLGGAAGAGAVVLTGAASPSLTTITVPQ